MNKQSFITILLIVLMSMTGAKAFAHDIEVANDYGKTIYYVWTNSNTELAVSYRGSRWNAYSNEYTGYVVIPKSVKYNGKIYPVTSIYNEAFSECRGLTSVTIPNSVISIGKYAFNCCSDLSSMTIPNSVISIGKYAFQGCSYLSSITIPTSVTSIGEHAFESCSSLTSVKVLVTNYSAFCNNKVINLIRTAIEKPIHLIDNKGSEITEYIVPNDVTSIGNYAFAYCSGLTSVTIPNSVTSIGSSAFSGCSGLKSVKVPVTDYSAFCKNEVINLIRTKIEKPIHLIDNEGAEITEYIVPNDVTSIGNYAFSYCSGLTSVIIGSGVLSIGKDAFLGTSLMKTIWLTNTPPSGYSNASGAVNYVSNDQFNISNKVVYKSLSSYFEVDGVRYVPVSPSERTCDAIDCVYDEKAVNLVIGSTVAYMGVTMNVKNLNQYLAYNNKHIKTLVIDIDGEVSNYAFANCSNIQSVTLGQKVSAIGCNAFQGCSSLGAIEIPDIVTVLNDYTFSGCKSLKEIKIKPLMTNINNYVFNNCTSLVKVTIADSKTTLTLGSNGSSPIFSSCPLDYVYIGRDISYQTSSYYGYSPFYRNTTLREVKITDKETEISENEFYGCSNLQTVTIGDGVTTIGKWAFSGCSSLKYFTFGSKLEDIGQEAFSDCSALVQITSMAKKAPACGSQALEDINKWECKLYVPKGYLSVYQTADQWMDFWFMEEGEYIPPMKGDVNSDGKVDKDDLRDLVEYIMGNKPNGVTDESANVNGDNKVNVNDIVALVTLLNQQKS